MINWIITNIECLKEKEGLKNVAKNVHYVIEVSDKYGNTASCWGNQQLDLNSIDPKDFKDFNLLTKDQVVKWVKLAMGVENLHQIYERLDEDLRNNTQPNKTIGLPSSW